MAKKPKKRKAYRDQTFLISESKGQYRVFLILAVGSAAVVYLKTLCHTVSAADAGELITACFTLGIAHWPGYPLYVILGNLFINMFQGADPAYTVNLMSAFFGMLTVGFLYAVLYHFTRIPFLSASVALLFAWCDTFWSVSVIAEVYTLHTFFTAVILYLLTVWIERRSEWVLYVVPFLIGLACTNHQLSFLLVPLLIYTLFIFNPKEGFEKYISNGVMAAGLILLMIALFFSGWLKVAAIILVALVVGWIILQNNKQKLRYWLIASGCFVAGLLVYLYLPIRASMSPAHNWGNPSDIGTFLKAVIIPVGSQAPGGNMWIHLNYLFNPFPGFTGDIWPWTKGLWVYEFLSPVFFLFGLWGIYVSLKTGWRFARALVLYILLNIIVIVAITQPPSNQLFKIDAYYLQALLAFTIFIAVGVKEWLLLFGDVFKLKRYRVFGVMLIMIILAAPLILLSVNYKANDRSRDTLALDYSKTILSSVHEPARSILLVNSDDLFLLWYLEKVNGEIAPVYPLVPFPGMPGSGGDVWLGWYNHELAMEDAPRVLFSIPPDGKEWLTPEDALNEFIMLNAMEGKNIYLSSYGKWRVNIDINGIDFPIRPYNGVYKVFNEEDLLNKETITTESLSFWQEVFKQQDEQLVNFVDSPGRRDRDEFMISRYRDNLFSHANWASIYGMKNEAFEFCKICLQIDPYFIDGLDFMAHLLMEMGDMSKAESYITELLRIGDDFPGFHRAAADFYYTTGKFEKALIECKKAIELDPGDPEARKLLEKIEGKTD